MAQINAGFITTSTTTSTSTGKLSSSLSSSLSSFQQQQQQQNNNVVVGSNNSDAPSNMIASTSSLRRRSRNPLPLTQRRRSSTGGVTTNASAAIGSCGGGTTATGTTTTAANSGKSATTTTTTSTGTTTTRKPIILHRPLTEKTARHSNENISFFSRGTGTTTTTTANFSRKRIKLSASSSPSSSEDNHNNHHHKNNMLLSSQQKQQQKYSGSNHKRSSSTTITTKAPSSSKGSWSSTSISTAVDAATTAAAAGASSSVPKPTTVASVSAPAVAVTAAKKTTTIKMSSSNTPAGASSSSSAPTPIVASASSSSAPVAVTAAKTNMTTTTTLKTSSSTSINASHHNNNINPRPAAAAASSMTIATDDKTVERPAGITSAAASTVTPRELMILQREANFNKSLLSPEQVVSKRKDYMSWDDYFMAVAALSAQRSNDPIHPTGACIVDTRNRIIGIGCNRFPFGCSDDCLPWKAVQQEDHSGGDDTATTAASGSVDGGLSDADIAWLQQPQPYTVPAEVDAILNKCTIDCDGARLYTKQFPDNDCAKIIVQSNIAEVIHLEEGTSSDEHRASRILFEIAGIKTRLHKPQSKNIELNFWKTLSEEEAFFGIENDHDDNHINNVEKEEEMVINPKQEALKYRSLMLKEAKYDPVIIGSLKRKDTISWDDHFMAMALLAAQRSKDPSTQVGACIIDKERRIVGMGYNGFPNNCSDDHLPWSRQATNPLHTKYMYVCHAEVNAILNKGSANLDGTTMYVALFPCNACARMIIQSKIKEVVYMSDRYHSTKETHASRIMFHMAGVKLRQHIPDRPCISINI